MCSWTTCCICLNICFCCRNTCKLILWKFVKFQFVIKIYVICFSMETEICCFCKFHPANPATPWLIFPCPSVIPLEVTYIFNFLPFTICSVFLFNINLNVFFHICNGKFTTGFSVKLWHYKSIANCTNSWMCNCWSIICWIIIHWWNNFCRCSLYITTWKNYSCWSKQQCQRHYNRN